MTRTETLALYRPIRASIRRITDLAISVCDRADMMRAAKQLGLWVNGTIVFPDDGAMEMLGDVALFEPNQGGRRAFDRFLSEKAPQFDAADFELAQRMGKAFFSLFRCKGKHEVAGIWLEDLLDEGRSLWLMDKDKSAEVFVPAGATFGMRLFDAGAFYVAFAFLPPVDEETIEFCVRSKTRSGRFAHSDIRFPSLSTAIAFALIGHPQGYRLLCWEGSSDREQIRIESGSRG